MNCHSNVGFLQADANGVKPLREAMELETGTFNFHVSGNCRKFCRWVTASYGVPCTYLPNLYYQYGWRPDLPDRRDRMLTLPAPSARPIPAGDWCHFAARVERTALHRELKAGEMSYEDEKFSCLIASRGPVEPAQARIIRRPQKNPGLIQLSLCTKEEIIERQVRKRDGEA